MTVPGAVDPASVAIQEFIALRAEISTRTTSQSALVNITAVAVGGIGGFALGSSKANPLVLLVLAPLVAATGLQWLDHAHAIYKIGVYIKTDLWAQVRATLGVAVSSYEEYVLLGEPKWRERSVLIIPFFVIFVSPGIAGLAYVAVSADNVLTWSFWSVEVLAMLYFISTWTSFLREALRSGDVKGSDSAVEAGSHG